MEYFFRSVKYVLPYKARLAGALACVAMISLLWAGGLSVIIPAAKILVSAEGLHGWADQTMAHARLEGRTVRREITTRERRPGWDGVADVMLVTALDTDGVAAAAGVRKYEWIVGVDDRFLGFDELHQELAGRPPDGTWSLWVCDPDDAGREPRRVTVTPKAAGLSARMLRWVAGRTPRPQTRADRFGLLVWVLVLGLLVTILRDLFRFLQGYIVQTTVFRAIMDVRDENYATAVRLPLSYFSTKGTSDTISRFVADLNQMARGLITLLGKTLVEPGKLLTSFLAALYLNWKLTVLACVAGPPVYFLIRRLGKLMRRATKRALQSRSRMLAAMQETLGAIRLVKAYTNEQTERARMHRLSRQLYKEVKPMVAADAATGPAVEAMGVVAAMAAVALAGYWVLHQGVTHTGPAAWILNSDMDSETFFGMLVLLAAMYDPVRKLSQVATRFHAADAACSSCTISQSRPTCPGRPTCPTTRTASNSET